MPQKDNIERLIEAFFEVIRQILRLEQLGRHMEAQELLQRAARQYVGLSLAQLDILSFESVISILSMGGTLDVQRCLFLADLRLAEAQLHQGEGQPAAAMERRITALRLCVEAMTARDAGILGGRTEEVAALVEELRGSEISADARHLIAAYEHLSPLSGPTAA